MILEKPFIMQEEGAEGQEAGKEVPEGEGEGKGEGEGEGEGATEETPTGETPEG